MVVLVRLALRAVIPATVLAMALALWSLLGATTGAAWMRPPIEGGLSHPVSALCLLLLGASVLVPAGLRRGVPVLAGGVLLMVAAGVAPRLTALAQPQTKRLAGRKGELHLVAVAALQGRRRARGYVRLQAAQAL